MTETVLSDARTCAGCGTRLVYGGRGRPRRWCESCTSCGEKQRAYYEANRDEIAEKKRAYYEANRDEIAEKKRAYRNGLVCSECGAPTTRVEQGICRACERTANTSAGACLVCGDPLMFVSESGLCGFCEFQQAPAAAA